VRSESVPSRDIELADTYNLRDLGGYPTVDGRRVAWRRLFRGASLQRLGGEDAAVVGALGLRTAIDLRTVGEVARSGAYPTDVLPATLHRWPMIAAVWDLAGLDPDEPAERYLLARYRDMLGEGAPVIASVMETLADRANLPAVFYCAAGKDRTGVLAALILDALGVEPERIVADYHLSKERVDRIRARALATAGERASAMVAQPPAFMQAPAEAMALLLAAIRDEFGSTTAYLRSIGVSDATLEAVRDNLLEASP
jgi:protein-tyrosine phosphatase